MRLISTSGHPAGMGCAGRADQRNCDWVTWMSYQRIIRAGVGVAIVVVGTPNTQDLARITPSLLTKATGIKAPQ